MAQPVGNVIDFNARRQERLRRNANRPQSSSTFSPAILPMIVMAPMMVPLVWTGGWVFATQLMPVPPGKDDH